MILLRKALELLFSFIYFKLNKPPTLYLPVLECEYKVVVILTWLINNASLAAGLCV